MSDFCKECQEHLAEGGVPAVEARAELSLHLAGCADCSEMAEALLELDLSFQALPGEDVADGVVERLLERVVEAGKVAEVEVVRPAAVTRLSAIFSALKSPVAGVAIIVALTVGLIVATAQVFTLSLGDIVLGLVTFVTQRFLGVVMLLAFLLGLVFFVKPPRRQRFVRPFAPAAAFLSIAGMLFTMHVTVRSFFGSEFSYQSDSDVEVARPASGSGESQTFSEASFDDMEIRSSVAQIFGMFVGSSNREQPPVELAMNSPKASEERIGAEGNARPKDNEAANDLVTAFESNLKSLEKDNEGIRADAERTRRQLEASLSKTGAILEILTEKAETFDRKLEQIEGNQKAAESKPVDGPAEEGVPSFGDTDRVDADDAAREGRVGERAQENEMELKAKGGVQDSLDGVYLRPDHSSIADDKNGRIEPVGRGAGEVTAKQNADKRESDVLYGDPEQNDLMKAFNGWQEYYMGYVRSPIIFDPRDPDFKRLYPELAKDNLKSSSEEDKRSITSYKLGVDNVLAKSSMAKHRLPDSIEKDSTSSSDDLKMRQLYESVVRTANLTLAFLDKTIAASLATEKGKAHQGISNRLLKQIIWATKEEAKHRKDEIAYSEKDIAQVEKLVRAGLDGGPGAYDEAVGRYAKELGLRESEITSTPAKLFLHERDQTTGLSFKQPIGYWSNTYIPGDPLMRLLEMRLAGADKAELSRYLGTAAELETLARQTTQPFDVPKDSALGISLQADRVGVSGESRMLVQVGIKGAERLAGHRSAMNVGVVMDLRGEVAPEISNLFQSVLFGMNSAKDIGDRFSVTVAGKPGGTILSPENFRHGAITVAYPKLFAPAEESERSFSPEQALEEAIAKVAASDDPNSPLGVSEVLYLTAQPLGAELTGSLSQIAHRAALKGVTVSVIGIGKDAQASEIDSIALAGQGNRRLLGSVGEAEELVKRELQAASRIIARALRLRIKLAPGVKLVDVIGSENLSEAAAQRTREAEQSIDKRVAKSLGIEADRGEDEEGIQVIIPAFYSADSHVILLDVVVPGPGPVAEVTARFKDLVRLKNGVSRASLAVPQSNGAAKGAERGVLELNVLKNLLAQEFSFRLKSASSSVASNRTEAAIELLDHYKSLLESLQTEYPLLSRDTDVQLDLSMLNQYITLVQSDAMKSEESRKLIADSLRYAGFLKLQPQPKRS